MFFWQVGTLLAPFFLFDLHVLRLVVFGARICLRCIAAIARNGDPRCFCRTWTAALSKKSLRWTKKRAIEVMQGHSQHLIREVWAGNLQRDTWTVMRKMLENTNCYGFCCQVISFPPVKWNASQLFPGCEVDLYAVKGTRSLRQPRTLRTKAKEPLKPCHDTSTPFGLLGANQKSHHGLTSFLSNHKVLPACHLEFASELAG